MPEPSALRGGSASLEPAGTPDESESEGEEKDAEQKSGGFRVFVELSPMCGAGARCVLWVPRGRGRLRRLARRLRRAAALRGPFVLACAGHALAPADPLRLLRPGDALRVLPVEHDWQKPFSFEDDNAAAAPRASYGLPTPAARSTPPSEGLSLEPPDLDSPGLSLKNLESLDETDSGGEALQCVKRRALALLQRVALSRARGDGEPPRKRRRRVRRRRAPPPAAFAPDPTHFSPEPALCLAEPASSPPQPARSPLPRACSPPQAARSPPPPVRSPPQPARSPPPPAQTAARTATVVHRNPSPARAPRLVRALPSHRLDYLAPDSRSHLCPIQNVAPTVARPAADSALPADDSTVVLQ